MKVSELITRLQKFPQDYRVVTYGYEGGVDDLQGVVQVKIAVRYRKDTGYFGEHEIDDGCLWDEDGIDRDDAVLIFGRHTP